MAMAEEKASSSRTASLATQLAVVAGTVGIGAAVVVAIGSLTMPEPPPPFVAADADPEALPSPEDLNEAGAVVVASGSPVDDGVIEHRYELTGTGALFVELGESPPEGEGEFRFGRAPRTLLVRWSWVDGEEGGDITEVRATLSLPGATFFARAGECDLDLHVYEPYQETFEMETFETEDDTGEVEVMVRRGVEAEGILDCQGVVAVGMDGPISYQAVFRIPRQDLFMVFPG